MMRDINYENTYSDTGNKLASFLAELSNKIVPEDITIFKVCEDLKNMQV